MAERRHEYAPAGTLPGLLQRGRGLGARMAAEDPAGAADLVYGCIRWEWRWDSQTDDRHLYLARLIRDLELPLGPVVEMLALDEDTRRRAAYVLELLVRGGSAEARAALPGYVPEPEEEAPPRHRPKPSDESDVPALIAELEQHWVDQSWCGPDRLAGGLARFGAKAAGAASLLRRFWLWTPHSYERAAYLEALAAMGAAGMAEAYTESLWDCEVRARLLGVGHAPDRAEVRERLAHLRDDPMEEPGVRTAAAARLAGLAWAPSVRAREAPRRGLE
ncbi:hypothetical protein [Kitasatospora sp. SUK 42]|uniref:hypothetical protein n=1 Tax=Kitasatospora sp. SUK 42 TaxID=1588882 RepID=UPI0018C9B7F9|nr:hypothetical protein [Kitasatospora sp. SUK 42]MBV2153549.1 hypothetical protein [Kitasatospora sp. SUK 42]